MGERKSTRSKIKGYTKNSLESQSFIPAFTLKGSGELKILDPTPIGSDSVGVRRVPKCAFLTCF